MSPPQTETLQPETLQPEILQTATLQTETLSRQVSFRPAVLELEAGGRCHLVGSRCPVCGAHFFPARQVCSRCLTQDLAAVPLSRHGTLYTYTVVRQSVPAFEVPYMLGYVDLPEGVRVLGQLVGLSEGTARIGMPLVLATQTVGTDADGRGVVGYCFRAEPDRADGADRADQTDGVDMDGGFDG